MQTVIRGRVCEAVYILSDLDMVLKNHFVYVFEILLQFTEQLDSGPFFFSPIFLSLYILWVAYIWVSI